VVGVIARSEPVGVLDILSHRYPDLWISSPFIAADWATPPAAQPARPTEYPVGNRARDAR
jgi:hypothetical protein